MTVQAIIHQQVQLDPRTVNEIVLEKLESMFNVVLNKGLRPDTLYIDSKGDLMKFEEMYYSDKRTKIREATALDIALELVIREIKKQ